MAGDYQVGCCYFPNYHGDPRNERVHGEGWNGWTQGSYLEPDTVNDTAYLEAVHGVFGRA